MFDCMEERLSMAKPHIARQIMLPFADWAVNLQIPMLQMENDDGYIPIRPLVRGLLGTDDDRGHRARIQRDPILSQLSCYLPVQTDGCTQDMLCLPWLGIGRFIDRLSLESVREPYRAQVLNVMWAITFAAYEVVSGKRAVPHLITIIPAERVLASVPDQEVRKFLVMLADRIGRMEVSSRALAEANADIKVILSSLLGTVQDESKICPCCGRAIE
jgi:hypothetical protein